MEDRIGRGDEAAQLALDVYVHRLRHYLGAYASRLGRLDLVVFTAGVGENSGLVRAAATAGLGTSVCSWTRSATRSRPRSPGSSPPTNRR